MNLRVDLIFETEQRSASAINVKTVTKILGIGIPLIVLVLILSVVIDAMAVGSRLRFAESEWAGLEPRKKEAALLKQQTLVNKDILQELDNWDKSHMDWHLQLEALRKGVPADLQLTSLRVSQSIQLVEKNAPAIVFRMVLNGKAAGSSAEQNIQGLRSYLEEAPELETLIDEVEVQKYGADPENKEDRVFQIECTYQPRKF